MTQGFNEGGLKSEEMIVAGNLDKMKTEMIDLLFGESIGGNAGTFVLEGRRFPCGAANAFFDRFNGEIAVFGNIQEGGVQAALKEDTEKRLWGIRFKVAIDISKGPVKIVDVYYDNQTPINGKENPTIEEAAKRVIQMSVEEYNKSLVL